jgi:hypothetical protein|tara:strand:- start:3926 stop:4525 length:600 start_codon:yes stop_codon:yes gene_type:complete
MNQQEFYENIPMWISKDKDSWNHITLMAYFCHKYEQKHGVRFRLVRWKGDPGKGKESRDFAKLFKILAPEDIEGLSAEERFSAKKAVTLKIYNYINWMFDFKFRRGDRSVTGTGLFLMPSMINEFERMYSNHLSQAGSKDKIERLVRWAKTNAPKVLDEHELDSLSDLKMIEKYVKIYSLEDDSQEAILLAKAREMEVL